MTLQFVLFNLVALLVIVHYLDSAKEHEWTDAAFRGNYKLWLLVATVLFVVLLVGFIPIYLHTQFGHAWALVTSVGGLAGYGYHKFQHHTGRSTVCLNRTSYAIMYALNIACLALIAVTLSTSWT